MPEGTNKSTLDSAGGGVAGASKSYILILTGVIDMSFVPRRTVFGHFFPWGLFARSVIVRCVVHPEPEPGGFLDSEIWKVRILAVVLKFPVVR